MTTITKTAAAVPQRTMTVEAEAGAHLSRRIVAVLATVAQMVVVEIVEEVRVVVLAEAIAAAAAGLAEAVAVALAVAVAARLAGKTVMEVVLADNVTTAGGDRLLVEGVRGTMAEMPTESDGATARGAMAVAMAVAMRGAAKAMERVIGIVMTSSCSPPLARLQLPSVFM